MNWEGQHLLVDFSPRRGLRIVRLASNRVVQNLDCPHLLWVFDSVMN